MQLQIQFVKNVPVSSWIWCFQDDSLPEEAVQLRMEIEQEIGGQSPQHSLHAIHASPIVTSESQPNIQNYSVTSQIR